MLQNVAKGVEVYDETLHYPWLLRLTKSAQVSWTLTDWFVLWYLCECCLFQHTAYTIHHQRYSHFQNGCFLISYDLCSVCFLLLLMRRNFCWLQKNVCRHPATMKRLVEKPVTVNADLSADMMPSNNICSQINMSVEKLLARHTCLSKLSADKHSVWTAYDKPLKFIHH